MVLHGGGVAPVTLGVSCDRACLVRALPKEGGGMMGGADSWADSLAVPRVFGRMPNTAGKMPALPTLQIRTQAAASSLLMPLLYLSWSVVHSLAGMSQRLPM